MFDTLKRRIIVVTMAIVTVVIVLAFSLIFLITSASTGRRREIPNVFRDNGVISETFEEEMREQKNFHLEKLALSLTAVGVALEVLALIITVIAADKIVAPVEKSYEKQREFIANASHELKTPIAALRANFEALGVEEKPWSDNIELELDKANRLICDLLQLAKMGCDTTRKPQKKRVDLTDLTKRHVDAVKPRMGEKKITLETKGEIAQEMVGEDFAQILDILLDNAAKYAATWVKVSLSEKSLIVKNDGEEIPKEKLEHLFERFYQIDKTAQGSGLGLAIAKAVAERNNWNLTVRSDAKATSFRLVLRGQGLKK